VRASVFKAYVGAYWKQCTALSDRYDNGSIHGHCPNPVTTLRSWLDRLIEHEVIQLREAADLAESMGNTSLGGSLALLNEKASKRKPPVELEWEESEEGSPHKKTFSVEVKGKHPQYLLLLIETYLVKIYAVGGQVVGRGVAYKKKAAKNEAAERGLEFLGWVSRKPY